MYLTFLASLSVINILKIKQLKHRQAAYYKESIKCLFFVKLNLYFLSFISKY